MMSDMENKDWLNDYESLKQVSNANPFTVPEGYFDDLGERIVSRVNLEELKNSGYFGGFFSVPENYFDELEGNIQSRINIENAVNIEDAGFIIPEGYFDNLEQQIKSRIFIEETLGEPAASFSVPEDYFNKLNKNILDKTINVKSNKDKGIVVRLFASTAFKYATAACFAVAIGGGILLNELSSSANQHTSSFLHKQLSTVPIDDIKAYLQLNVDAGDTQQTVASNDVGVDDNSLKNALQNSADSLQ